MLSSKRGYYFNHSDETLIKYMNLSPAHKLKWLEEVNRFLYKAMSKEKREIWQKYRSGEI